MKKNMIWVEFVIGFVAGAAVMTAQAKSQDTDPWPNGYTHDYSTEGYVAPKEQAVREKLEWFRDQKLGLMMHFGLYSQTGEVESWGLCERVSLKTRDASPVDPRRELYKRNYWNLITSFNPCRLEPEVWADIAKRNGFKYLIFTTKHHDGFCLFDSKHSDYKVTAKECPYSAEPKPDIVRRVFDAFRAKGIGIAAYFSKPDWHHPDYWEDHGLGYRTSAGPSYDVKKNPEKWGRFASFVRNQILELVGGYGPIDILWLDGGQVQKGTGLDVNMEKIVAEARKLKPDLISVDRTAAGGVCENVVTPECTVPPKPLAMPWESCVPMGSTFAYTFDDTYKTPRELVHLLMDIVAKGGNLALNIPPCPNGRLPKTAVANLDGLGAWLKRNGEAVYGTRIVAPYRHGDWAFTQKQGAVYATFLRSDANAAVRTFACPVKDAAQVKKVVHLASGAELSFAVKEGALVFSLPTAQALDLNAETFRIVF